MATDPNLEDQVPLTSPPRKAAPPPHDDEEPEGPPDAEALAAELARTREALKKANKITVEKRLRLEELERAEEGRRVAGLSEDQRAERARAESEARAAELQRRAEQAERERDEARLERLVDTEARRYSTSNAEGFINPEIAYKLIDRDLVQFDPESGRWTGVRESIKRLADLYPGLLKQKPRGPGSPPRDEYPGNPRLRPAGRPANNEPADAFEAAIRMISRERM